MCITITPIKLRKPFTLRDTEREEIQSAQLVQSEKDLLFIKKGEKTYSESRVGARYGSGARGWLTHRSLDSQPGVTRVCQGSTFLPHPSSSSPGSQNPFLWLLAQLLPQGSAAPAFLPTCRGGLPSPLQPALLSAPQNSSWRRGCRDAEAALWDRRGAECGEDFVLYFPWRGPR